jgi:hypothetical protein
MLPVLPLILLGGGAIALFTLGGGKKANVDGTSESAASKIYTELKRAADDGLKGTAAQRKEYAAFSLAMLSVSTMREGTNLDTIWNDAVADGGGEMGARQMLYAESRGMITAIDMARETMAKALHGGKTGPVTYKQFVGVWAPSIPNLAQAVVDEAKRLGHTVSLNGVIPPAKPGSATVGWNGSRFRGCMSCLGSSTWPIRPNF